VGDVSVVGCVGSLIVATRGAVGAGEVLLNVRESTEAYLAWSPLSHPSWSARAFDLVSYRFDREPISGCTSRDRPSGTVLME
jgi:hypothetical protein